MRHLGLLRNPIALVQLGRLALGFFSPPPLVRALGSVSSVAGNAVIVILSGGAGEIRTLGWLFTNTDFPGLHLKPLGHRSREVTG